MAAYEFADEDHARAYVANLIPKDSYTSDGQSDTVDISNLFNAPAAAGEHRAFIWEVIDWFKIDDQGNMIPVPGGSGGRGLDLAVRTGTVVYEYHTGVSEPVYTDANQDSHVELGGPGSDVLQRLVDYTFSRVR